MTGAMANHRNSRYGLAWGVLKNSLILLVCTVVMVSCRESQVRSYQVPAEKVAPPQATTQAPLAATEVEIPHWELPAGWKEVPGTGMRFATIIVEAGDPPLEIRVTPLTMAAGDLLDNINRWRQQIELPPVSAVDVGPMVKSLDAGGRAIDYVNLTGPATSDKPARQILAGILPGSQQLWFFLMFDEASRVARHTAEFEAFLGTVHLAGTPSMGHDYPDLSTTDSSTPDPGVPVGSMPGAGGDETMTWTLPGGWAIDPTPRDMRVATIKLSDGAGEMAITRFAGPGGDLLANVNRWRNQLGLPPVADQGGQASESIELAGFPARLFDISESGGDAARKRTLVVGLSRPGMSWFIKMTGPHDLLDREEPAFRQFLGSVRMAAKSR